MAESKGSNKLIIILFVITLVIVFGAAAVFGYMILKKNTSGSTTQKTTTQSKVNEKTVDLPEFVVNLADNDNTYIKITPSLGYTDSKTATEINDKMPQISDVINKILRSKKSQDFAGDGLNKVQKELVDSINSIMDKGKITNIYFKEIIIQ